MYTHISTHKHIPLHTYMHIDIGTHIHPHMHTYTYAHICMYTYPYVHKHISHTFIHVNTYVYTRLPKHTHTNEQLAWKLSLMSHWRAYAWHSLWIPFPLPASHRPLQLSQVSPACPSCPGLCILCLHHSASSPCPPAGSLQCPHWALTQKQSTPGSPELQSILANYLHLHISLQGPFCDLSVTSIHSDSDFSSMKNGHSYL